jgi:hypothetical protein
MKRKKIIIISLAGLMLINAFISCTNSNGTQTATSVVAKDSVEKSLTGENANIVARKLFSKLYYTLVEKNVDYKREGDDCYFMWTSKKYGVVTLKIESQGGKGYVLISTVHSKRITACADGYVPTTGYIKEYDLKVLEEVADEKMKQLNSAGNP